jgi:hypothetical protein
MAMSDEHRAALKQGRAESKAIREYLEAIGKRKPGRPVTRESLEKRIASTDAQLAEEDDPLKRVDLFQRRIEAEEQLANLEDVQDMGTLEDAFCEYAKSYSDRKGISYAAWRAEGVPAAVLKKAGISRSGN